MAHKGRTIQLQGTGHLTRRNVADPTYHPLENESKQDFEIVAIAERRNFVVTFWHDGTLYSRDISATSEDEAIVLLKRELNV